MSADLGFEAYTITPIVPHHRRPTLSRSLQASVCRERHHSSRAPACDILPPLSRHLLRLEVQADPTIHGSTCGQPRLSPLERRSSHRDRIVDAHHPRCRHVTGGHVHGSTWHAPFRSTTTRLHLHRLFSGINCWRVDSGSSPGEELGIDTKVVPGTNSSDFF